MEHYETMEFVDEVYIDFVCPNCPSEATFRNNLDLLADSDFIQ